MLCPPLLKFHKLFIWFLFKRVLCWSLPQVEPTSCTLSFHILGEGVRGREDGIYLFILLSLFFL